MLKTIFKFSFKNLSWPGIIADLILIAIVFYMPFFKDFLAENVIFAFSIVGILQVLTILGLMVSPTIFEVPDSKNAFLRFFQSISSLLLILSIGGFIWFYFPAQLISDPWGERLFLINMMILLFGSIIALAMQIDREGKKGFFETFNKSVSPILFLTVSELLILAYAAQSQEIGFTILMLGISYLPIRTLLIFKPPLSIVEIMTAVSALVVFVGKIISS